MSDFDYQDYVKEKLESVESKIDRLFSKFDKVKDETIKNSVNIKGLWAAVGALPVVVTVVLTIIFKLWK